jgi:ATP-dependent Clp protease ATP-binding subunit ClpA
LLQRAGATTGGSMDASNLLKPALASGTVRCIGSTTYKEYRQYFEKDRALVRRFQKIDVNEPTIPDAIEILKGLKPYFEDYHKLKYTSDAIKAAVELSSRYIHDRKLPDKAIDVIDGRGATPTSNTNKRKRVAVHIVRLRNNTFLQATGSRRPKRRLQCNQESSRLRFLFAPLIRRCLVCVDRSPHASKNISFPLAASRRRGGLSCRTHLRYATN